MFLFPSSAGPGWHLISPPWIKAKQVDRPGLIAIKLEDRDYSFNSSAPISRSVHEGSFDRAKEWGDAKENARMKTIKQEKEHKKPGDTDKESLGSAKEDLVLSQFSMHRFG